MSLITCPELFNYSFFPLMYPFILCMCVTVSVHVCHGAHVEVWERLQSVLSFHFVGCSDVAQITMINSKSTAPETSHLCTDFFLSFSLPFFFYESRVFLGETHRHLSSEHCVGIMPISL